MPTVSLAGFFNLQVETSTGVPAASYRLYSYAPNTTTHKDAYTEPTGTTAHTYTSDGSGGQYIALDSRGELPAPLFLQGGGYDLVLKTDTGSSVWTRRAYGAYDVSASVGAFAVAGALSCTGNASLGDAVADTLSISGTTVKNGSGNWAIPAPVSGNHTVSGGWLEIGTGGIGYATGAGGTVTQGTSKSTGVTLNKNTGTITMHNAALNATTSVAFTLTNSTIAATDVVHVVIKSGATSSSYFVQVEAVAAGSCVICVRNYTGGNLSEALVLSFVVIKGVAA